MATASAEAALHKNASFIYFWLGLLTGALIVIITMMFQSALRDGQASILRDYSLRTYDTSITDPQTLNSITDPQTRTSITDPQTLNAITDPQTLTR